jgi:hypothetical protein
MATPIGLRKVKAFINVPANTEKIIDEHGNFGYIEVTNDTASAVDFLVNDYPEQGHQGTAIPIKANTTRPIPLTVYKFKATGVVTVVAYGY